MKSDERVHFHGTGTNIQSMKLPSWLHFQGENRVRKRSIPPPRGDISSSHFLEKSLDRLAQVPSGDVSVFMKSAAHACAGALPG